MGLLDGLKKFGKECLEEFNREYTKARNKAEQQQAQAATSQAAQGLGQQPPTGVYQQGQTSQTLTQADVLAAQQHALEQMRLQQQLSRVQHLKKLHAQASSISSPEPPVVNPHYPVGDRRRYGR